jgi:putative transposase
LIDPARSLTNRGIHRMTDSKVIALKAPEADALSDILKQGAQALLRKAVEAEVAELLSEYQDVTVDGKQAVVRNGHLPERTVQTGIGEVPVKVPKVRDRSGQGIKFNSKLLPPYLKRTRAMEEFIPWLYLKGVSTGDMQPALESLLGEGAKGLSPTTVSRLKSVWESEYDTWRQRDLSKRRYVYLWADGVYSNVRLDDRLCLLVIVGSDESGRKEVLAVSDGYRESEASWLEVLEQLTQQGLTIPPKLAVGDGALGFWKALTKHWPTTAQQRCWVHKTANVLNKLPKAMQPKVKEALQDIWMAEGRDAANQAFDSCVIRFEDKYPGAMKCLVKDREQMLAFYDFPAPHWQHIRTTNPIESVFSTVRLRTDKVKNCGSRKTTLTMAWKLMTTAQQRWQRLRGHKLLADVIEGVKFKDGKLVEDDQPQAAG